MSPSDAPQPSAGATDEEVAAIVAAVEAVMSPPVLGLSTQNEPPRWRFSGRWWARPVAARRDRPW